MYITDTELKVNLGKYLLPAAKEDVYITRKGKVIAKLTNPYQDRVDMAKSLFGILPTDMTLEEAKEERLNYSKSPIPIYAPIAFLKMIDPQEEVE